MSRPAHLIRAIPVRLVDLSWSGCRVASHQPIDLGTTGELRMNVDGGEHRDPLQIVNRIERYGAGQTFTLGGKFLWRRRSDVASLRTKMPPLVTIP